MRKLANYAIVVAVICISAAVVSRVTMAPLGAMGIEAEAMNGFAQTCLLLAIALILTEKK